MAKVKIEIKTKCLSQNNTTNGSNATFVVEADKQPAPQPGQPRQIAARKVINCNFDDSTAKQFDTTKQYKITIEEV